MQVMDERFGNIVAKINVSPSSDWETSIADLKIENGKRPLYFTYCGEGAIDFLNFTLM